MSPLCLSAFLPCEILVTYVPVLRDETSVFCLPRKSRTPIGCLMKIRPFAVVESFWTEISYHSEGDFGANIQRKYRCEVNPSTFGDTLHLLDVMGPRR